MEYPASLALAQPVTSPPMGEGWWAEPKFDGHRVAIWRLPDAVRLHTRAGREVTSQWMDLAVPAMQLRPATVLDGEAVVYVGGRTDFAAVQARNASRPGRARVLAQYRPASYAAFDLLQHPDHGDVRNLPWLRRRELLLELLEDLGPPLQAVPATDDRDVADLWYEVLRDQGIEGLIWKHESSPYRGNRRIWRRQRHADTLDGTVVGFAGRLPALTTSPCACPMAASPCRSDSRASSPLRSTSSWPARARSGAAAGSRVRCTRCSLGTVRSSRCWRGVPDTRC